MNNIKDEFIKAIMQSLKIEKNPFIYSTIDEFISHLKPTDYKAFMSELFGTQHSYLNGLDRIAKVSEQFKPQTEANQEEEQAKELIRWCEDANTVVYENSTKSGRTFDDELKGTVFTKLNNKDNAVLNAVKPYCDYKQLIGNIRCYQDSQVQLQAFIDALKYQPSDAIQIVNPIENLRIKR